VITLQFKITPDDNDDHFLVTSNTAVHKIKPALFSGAHVMLMSCDLFICRRVHI